MGWWVRFERNDGKVEWLTQDKGKFVLSDEELAKEFAELSEAEKAIELAEKSENGWYFAVDSKTAPSNLLEGTTFTCPKCGSHMFGTSTADDKSTGYCHGYVDAPAAEGVAPGRQQCGYSWERSRTNDAKCFKGTGSFTPRVQVAQVVSP